MGAGRTKYYELSFVADLSVGSPKGLEWQVE